MRNLDFVKKYRILVAIKNHHKLHLKHLRQSKENIEYTLEHFLVIFEDELVENNQRIRELQQRGYQIWRNLKCQILRYQERIEFVEKRLSEIPLG